MGTGFSSQAYPTNVVFFWEILFKLLNLCEIPGAGYQSTDVRHLAHELLTLAKDAQPFKHTHCSDVWVSFSAVSCEL